LTDTLNAVLDELFNARENYAALADMYPPDKPEVIVARHRLEALKEKLQLVQGRDTPTATEATSVARIRRDMAGERISRRALGLGASAQRIGGYSSIQMFSLRAAHSGTGLRAARMADALRPVAQAIGDFRPNAHYWCISTRERIASAAWLAATFEPATFEPAAFGRGGF
jgi:hypothetical protein